MVGQLSRSYWIVPLDISPLHDIAIHWSFHPKRGPADYVLFTFKTPSMFFYYHPLDASDNTSKCSRTFGFLTSASCDSRKAGPADYDCLRLPIFLLALGTIMNLKTIFIAYRNRT
ncbi:hypothetical protein PGT21_005833 [Puccinia graminis f. sp. tritici]|uniref:Uncharacterized protein n=1 Tax=Puccinia graminis f. sp. tritici TaxID=56615 RepID=A0A5B0PK83_PUCGR|nr:hypothetical protein PGT21_005833 [Puccinia graminis f. sp. tritici]